MSRSAPPTPAAPAAAAVGLPPVLSRLRAVVGKLTHEELRAAFAAVDADHSAELDERELGRALRALGFVVRPAELADVFAFFDEDGNGGVSFAEFERFCAAGRAGDPAEGGSLGAVVARVRATLLAFGEDSLASLFAAGGGGAGAGAGTPAAGAPAASLTAPELRAGLARLGLGSLTPVEADALVRRIDADGDGRVSAAELGAFLRQKEFADGVRRVMRLCAGALRARGSSLQAVLEAAAAAGGGAGGAARAGTPPTVPAAALAAALTGRGFPLTPAQAAAVVGMSDIDGSGACDVEEVLYLAGDEYDAGGAGGLAIDAGDAGDDGGDANDDDDEEEEGVGGGGAAPGGGGAGGTARARALAAFAASAGVVFAPAGEGDDFFAPAGAPAAGLYGPLSAPLDAAAAAGAGEPTSLIGRSALEGVPLAAFQPSAPTPAAAWTDVVDSVHAAMSSRAAAGAGAAAGALDAARAPAALAALGLPLSSALVAALLTRVRADAAGGEPPAPPALAAAPAASPGAAAAAAGAQPAPGGPPLSREAFRALVDGAALLAAARGTAGMPALAEARVLAALRAHAGGAAAHGGLGAGGAGEEDALLSRAALAAALLAVPGAGLTPCEAIAVAAHAPGEHQPRALAAVHAHLAANAGVAGVAGEGGGGPRAALPALRAAARAAGAGAPRGGARFGLYPADPSLLRAAAAVPDAPGADPDVSSARFLSWLRALAVGGAALVLTRAAPPSAPDGVERFPAPVAVAFAALDPVARAGVARLVAGAVALPAPLTAASLPRPGSAGEAALPHARAAAGVGAGAGAAAGGGTGAAGGAPQHFGSAFVLLADRLPSCARPSRLAPLAYGHPALRLSRRQLLDGGWEADPGGVFARGSPVPPTVGIAPGTTMMAAALADAGVGAGAGALVGGAAGAAGAPAPHPLTVTSLTTAAGAGADGFGLTLRLASVLPAGAGEGGAGADAACVPAGGARGGAPPAALRALGADGGGAPGDAAWAADGATARDAASLLTALVTLTSAAAIPCPTDDVARASVLGRVVRVALAEAAFADAAAGGADGAPGVEWPRVRLLSNAVVVPAAWSPGAEDVWTFPDAATSPPSALVLRCDQPRDGAGAADAARVVFEFNLLLAHPAGGAAGGAAGAGAAAAAGAADEGGGDPYAPAALVPAGVPDAYPYEEVTVAWGAVPLSALAAPGAPAAVSVALTGGSPGSPADVGRGDVSQRRSGLSLLAKAVGGVAPRPVLTLAPTRVAGLRKSARRALARLPLTLVLPAAWAPAVEAARRAYAGAALAGVGARAAAPAPPFPVLDAPAAVFQALAAVAGPGGNATSLQAVAAAADAEVAARKKRGGTVHAYAYEEALAEAVLRCWAAVAAADAPAPDAPAGAAFEGARAAERVERVLAAGGSALQQLVGAGAVGAMRPVDARECLA